MRRGVIALFTLALLACLWPLTRQGSGTGTRSAPALAAPALSPVVIDAGHGGYDGGAVSVTGTQESGINLAVALRLEDILAFCGVPPVMIRREDVGLQDADAATIREKKVSDLHNRVSAVQALDGYTLISIHQNSFPEGRYSGAQVFYSPTEGSKELAEYTQETLRRTLNPNNNRQAKQIPDSVYLMNHIDCRAILVECGFLTNAEEEALLRDPDYQTKVAAALAGAYLSFEKTAPQLN